MFLSRLRKVANLAAQAKIAHQVLVAFIVLAALNANASDVSSMSDFERLSSGDKELPVMVFFKSDQNKLRRASKAAKKGDWLSLGNYIEEVTARGLNELGWINFNDYLKFKTVPAVARSVSRQEMQRLLASDRVESVEHDEPVERHLAVSTQAIGLPKALIKHSGGKGVTVAVIDDGVESSHPFFQGRVIDGLCVSVNSQCPGGGVLEGGVQAGNPAPGSSHGTHVAGIVAGASKDFTGVAPQANLVSARVFDADGSTSSGAILLAMEWVLQTHQKNNVVAVNMSLGGGRFNSYCDNANKMSQYFKQMIDELRSNNVAVITSAGNGSSHELVGRPACISSAVSVGALNRTGIKHAYYSDSYPHLTIMAPGGDLREDKGIVSSWIGGQYKGIQGTSMASPHVAGAWALIKASNPDASYQDILAMLTGSHIDRYTDPRNGFSIPKLDLAKALGIQEPVNPTPQPRPTPKPDPKPVEPAPKPKPAPKPQPPKEQRIDGILIERSGDKSSDKIEW